MQIMLISTANHFALCSKWQIYRTFRFLYLLNLVNDLHVTVFFATVPLIEQKVVP